MRYSSTQYAEALWSLLEVRGEKETHTIMRGFFDAVRRHGDWKKVGFILKELEALYWRSSGFIKVAVESTSPLSQETKERIASALQKPALFSEKVVPEILAGVKILINDEVLIDASAKRKLDALFS